MGHKTYELIIVGGGASGLMAAIEAAKAGLFVLVIDHHTEAVKKILSTGNGRCNYTNKKQDLSFYHCTDPDFCAPALKEFDADDCIRFFAQTLGIQTTERDGYCYPRSMQAATVRRALLNACESYGARILTDNGIRSIEKADGKFVLDTKSGVFYSERLILACGGKAAPKTGSDGSGFVYAKQLGHTMTPLLPALTGLECEAGWLKQTNGVRAKGAVSVYAAGEKLAYDSGELQFTAYGLSGIPVFNVSRFAARALQAGTEVEAVVDLTPEYSRKDIQKLFDPESSPENVLFGLLNDKLAQMILNLSGGDLYKIWNLLKELRIPVKGTKGFDQAQVTTGGICVDEVNPDTMESKLVSGLYIAGEMLDVDAICGGYNLQWAWASGKLAAKSAVDSIKYED